MPFGDELSAEEVELLGRWISEGAQWAIQKPFQSGPCSFACGGGSFGW